MKCGFYEREITPPIGDDIPGYSGPRFNTTIHDRLFVKAAAINTGDRIEDTVILIEMDLINVPAPLYDKALKKIEDLTQVPQKNILLAATHTHTGGPIYPDDEFRRLDTIWLESTTQSVADCAIMAFRSVKPATARIAEGKVENQAFCRDYLLSTGEIRTNPGYHNPLIVRPWGKNDPAFPVVFFYDEEGKPFGALTNFACHHDCKAGTEISADFSGVLAREMKKTYGADFVNILFSGACGNINSGNPMGEKRKHKGFLEVGWALADEERKLFDTAQPIEINRVDSVKKVLPIKRREVTPERLEEAHWLLEYVPTDFYQLNIANAENIMFKRCKAEAIIKHAAKPEKLPSMVQVIKLGEDLNIYALNGEIYTEYGLYIKEHSKAKYNIICTVSNKGAGGYVPTPDVFGTTVYPAQLPSSPLVPEAGQMIADFALEIAEELN